MREIKFRAWDPNKKIMAYPTGNLEMSFEEGYAHVEHSFTPKVRLATPHDADDDLAPSILMQYTGLKDKNGKEIYEGDIVRVYHRRGFYGDEGFYTVGKVEYSPAEFYINGGGHSITCHFHYDEKDREVIGNIHDKPELLKS